MDLAGVAETLRQHVAVEAQAGQRGPEFVSGAGRELGALAGKPFGLPDYPDDTETGEHSHADTAEKHRPETALDFARLAAGGVAQFGGVDADVPDGGIQNEGDVVGVDGRTELEVGRETGDLAKIAESGGGKQEPLQHSAPRQGDFTQRNE